MIELRQGMLIAFEGIDGAGKTTQARLLYARLKEASFDVILSKEPTEGVWGKKLRELIEKGRDGVAPEEELEWFLRDRKDHVARIIVPALQQKRIVILDRYYLSTIAYQGSLGIDPLVIETKNREFAPEPAILFLIDITPCAGVQRKKQNAHGKTDTFEQEKYLSTVSAMFSKYHRPFVRRLRGDEYVQTLANQTWEITMQYLVEHDLVISPSGNPLIKKRRCNYG